MNKKLLLIGALAIAGFVTLTAFGGKTKEQQMAEIKEKIQTGLDQVRAEEDEKCTTRVNEAAQTRFVDYQAEMEATAAKTPGKKSSSKAKGPRVDPLPTKAPTDPKKDKMESKPNTEEKKEKMAAPPNTDKKKAKMQGGGSN